MTTWCISPLPCKAGCHSSHHGCEMPRSTKTRCRRCHREQDTLRNTAIVNSILVLSLYISCCHKRFVNGNCGPVYAFQHRQFRARQSWSICPMVRRSVSNGNIDHSCVAFEELLLLQSEEVSAAAAPIRCSNSASVVGPMYCTTTAVAFELI